MKDKSEKEIKSIAQEIIKREKELQLGKNVKKNQDEIENIMCSLSLLDMLRVEEYISKNIDF